ncbi:MAG: type II toxin-antitoxin system Phd/YefM family antitoxin, partial [Geminicoccales bacterium]
MKTVSAREANQQFSRLLGEVAAGEEVVITHRGKPVATILPYRGQP